jgi:hypothetical protein
MPLWVGCNECDWLVAVDIGKEGEEQAAPCPRCTSTDRGLALNSEGYPRGYSSVVDRRGDGDPQLEWRSGDERFHNTRHWRKLTRVINRRDDRYREHIIDPDSGKTIKSVDERLSEHRGHGSAKQADRTDDA